MMRLTRSPGPNGVNARSHCTVGHDFLHEANGLVTLMMPCCGPYGMALILYAAGYPARRGNPYIRDARVTKDKIGRR